MRSVLWLRAAEAIDIEVFDAKSNTTITAIMDEVQTTELPTVAPEGYQVEVVGDPGNAYDNYHVEFEPRSGDFAEGCLAGVRGTWRAIHHRRRPDAACAGAAA